MIRRTVSTVILWTALGAVLYFFGAVAGVWLMAALAAASQHEFYRLSEATGRQPARAAGLIAGGALLLIPYHAAAAGCDPVAAGLSLFAVGLVFLAAVSLAAPVETRVDSLAAGVLGLALVAFPLHFFSQILLLGHGTGGLILALWVVVAVKFTDIGAFLAGTFWGRRKLAPSLSPGKTWEGVAGGLLASMLAAGVFAAIFSEWLPDALSPAAAAGLALPIAIASIPSDLLESLFKREAGAKDSGKTIPGIGGAYDLSDSLVLSAPVAFVLLNLVLAG